jgi:hypothetical protein
MLIVPMTEYEKLNFKVPQECDDYGACSEFVVKMINAIMEVALSKGANKIFIHTNLKYGLPMENINKVAGPFVEAWAFEVFQAVLEDKNNKYALLNVEAQERLNMSDIILQFKRERKASTSITAEVDVKATAEDFAKSGRSPNITSYARIRTAYVEDPDFLFIILSLKHKVYSKRNEESKMMEGVMEVVGYNTYDLKFLSSPDISYNPALGTGQLQVRDIHYVTVEQRTAWDFCKLLDKKFLASKRRSYEQWYKLALQFGWIKSEDTPPIDASLKVLAELSELEDEKSD